MTEIYTKQRIEPIRLNFLPLTTQEFEFRVYRKEYRGEKREGEENLYKNSLPVDIGKGIHSPDNRKDYWISFERKNGFEPFTCKQDYNHLVTLHFLFYLLLQKAKSSLKSSLYSMPDKLFRKMLFFTLQEYPEGRETVWLEPYYLQPVQKVGFLLDFKFRRKPNIPFSKKIQKLSLSLDKDYKSNRNFYIDKYKKIEEFLRNFRDILFPLIYDESLKIDISADLEVLHAKHLEAKKYVFGKGKTDISQYRGVEEHGPLEDVRCEVKFVCMYKEKDKDLPGDLIKALGGEFHGIPFKGIQNIFNLGHRNIEYLPIAEFSQENLECATKKIIAIRQANKNTLVMPIFIGYKEDSKTYYNLKYRLLKEDLPLQVVTIDLLKRKENLKWSISNIALQIFAKLGGKAWKVLPSHKDAIIFGVGQAHQKINGQIVKYFAYSICTDSSGIYKKINILGKSNDKESYLGELKKRIISTINENLTQEYNKCVLHIPFKIKRRELETIQDTIKEITSIKANLDFIVLKVNPDNKFFGYANTNSLVPYESSYIILSNKPRASYLVWFEGLQYHRETIYKRMPGPVYVEFYWSSKKLDEKEQKEYLQEVLNLSGANWRGFNAKNLPISIYYCQLVSDFLKNFPEEIENIENIPVPWFL